MQIFYFLASLCSSRDWFESYFVENPEDRFSHHEAHLNMEANFSGRKGSANEMGPVVRKLVFGVSEKVSFKPLSSAWMRMLVLPVLFANLRRQVFSSRGTNSLVSYLIS